MLFSADFDRRNNRGVKMKELTVAELQTAVKSLKAGERVLLSGTVYTARDAAHKRIFELLDAGAELPFELPGALIYYTGPTPAHDGKPVGSCGPTTSMRMDKFTPRLLSLGLVGIIGKGERGEAVCEALIKNNAVYFCAIGGAGALMASHVVSAEEIAFKELGCESVKRLVVEKLPLMVGIDCCGGNIFKDEKPKYADYIKGSHHENK
ncbi:MAG: FumA C-terminus/TtdB family hydratase beta subunit [Oscillospiraceae bacterium]